VWLLLKGDTRRDEKGEKESEGGGYEVAVIPRNTALHCVAELALWSKGKGVYPLEWGRSAAALAAALGCVSRGSVLEQKLRTSEGMQLAKGKRTGVN
jgi:hypothetical protein